MVFLVTFFFAAAVVFGFWALAWALGTNSAQTRENASPFECGFDPVGSARAPFSIRFFILAVLFLVFDVETILLFPLPIIGETGLDSLWAIFWFILFLVLGLLHEWREGTLEWVS